MKWKQHVVRLMLSACVSDNWACFKTLQTFEAELAAVPFIIWSWNFLSYFKKVNFGDIKVAEICTTGYCTRYTRLDCRTNLDKIKEFIENYKANWENHVLRIPSSRIPLQIFRYQPSGRRYLRRTLQTLTWDRNRPLGLRRGRLMMMVMM
jgi:hypothetical protein